MMGTRGPSGPQELPINPYLWAAAGALVGWAAAALAPGHGRAVLLENLVVGIFGAFLAADFLVAMLGRRPVAPDSFHLGLLGLAVAGAVVMVLLLRLMRGAVGPLRPGKSKSRRY